MNNNIIEEDCEKEESEKVMLPRPSQSTAISLESLMIEGLGGVTKGSVAGAGGSSFYHEMHNHLSHNHKVPAQSLANVIASRDDNVLEMTTREDSERKSVVLLPEKYIYIDMSKE